MQLLFFSACTGAKSNTIKVEDVNESKMQKQAPFLKKGDKIRVVAPAGVLDVAKTKEGIALWKSRGYNVELGKYIYNKHNRFAGTDQQRLSDLQDALNDTTCKAIVCARGGYGCIRIADKLDFSLFEQYPKWLIGFSDITVLHAHLQSLQIKSIHGPMVASSMVNGNASESFEYLQAILRGEQPEYTFDKNIKNKQGEAKGELMGGNLSILYGLLGNNELIDTKGKILFIEDLGEQLYHLDRMMQSLRVAGKLEHLNGLLVGEFIKMKDSGNMNETVEDIILDAVKDYNFPVWFDFPAGHDENNFPIIFGQEYQILEGKQMKMVPIAE